MLSVIPALSAALKTIKSNRTSLTVFVFCTMTTMVACSQPPEIENTVAMNIDDPKTVGCQTIEPDQTWIKDLVKIPAINTWLDPKSIEVTKLQFSGNQDRVTVRLHWKGYRDKKWYQDCRERLPAKPFTEQQLRLLEAQGAYPVTCKKKEIYEERMVAGVRPKILDNCIFTSPFHSSR